jgi:hypothetical protein
MTELIAAKTADEAIAAFLLHKGWQPFRYSGYKYLMKISDDTFQARERKPKTLKAGQELYAIVSQ